MLINYIFVFYFLCFKILLIEEVFEVGDKIKKFKKQKIENLIVVEECVDIKINNY